MDVELRHSDEFEQSVMIALLPTETYWSNLELPHMTLVYAGEIEDLAPTVHNDLAKAASSIAAVSSPIRLEVLTQDVFGEGMEQVDVLVLRPTPEVIAMRNMVEEWNASQYKSFKPHATIGPVGQPHHELPSSLTFDRIMVGWGNSQLVFRFKRNYDG